MRSDFADGTRRRRGRHAAAAGASLYVLSEETRWEWDVVSMRCPVETAAAGRHGSLADPPERMNEAARDVLLRLLQRPMRRSQVASALEVTQDQAREWLRSGLAGGALKRSTKPVRYIARQVCLPGFDVTPSRGPASGRALAAVLRRAFLAAALPLLQSPVGAAAVSSELEVTAWQAKRWLERLAADRTLIRVGGAPTLR